MTNIPARTTVDIQQIADIAGVGRSAVGNWRKRHADFPVPDTSGRFELREVERWLIENGKIDSRVPPVFVAWSLADTLRDTLVADETASLLIAVLVYLQACEEPTLFGQSPAFALTVPESAAWRSIRDTPPESLGERLNDAAQTIEDANPMLEGLMVPGLSNAPLVAGKLLHQLIDSLDRAVDDITPNFALFEEVVGRASELDRFRGEFATPDDVTELMVRVAGRTHGTVLDPACGQGGLLLSAAIHPDRLSTVAEQLVGIEINPDVLRVARARFFLYGVKADLRQDDVFRIPSGDLPVADLVLVDPPLGMRDWGDADVYLDQRWVYGLPPRNNADFAWLQLAALSLKEGGRAVVVASAGSTFRGGTEGQVRRSMIEAGTVEAIVQLPGRLRAHTSVPLVLWILRTPNREPRDVLFVDASALGTTGRSQHTFEEMDVERIAEAVRSHASHSVVEDDEIAWAVASDTILSSDAILDPSRYRPVAETNIADVRLRAAELRDLLPGASVAAGDAVKRLLARLDSQGQR